MSHAYPAFLMLHDRQCVVFGSGHEAEAKVGPLLDAGARVTLVSPSATPPLRQLAAQGRLVWRRRSYRPGDLGGAWLAITTPGVRDRNPDIWREAERERVLLNAMDDVPHCHFIAPAVHREGDLTVAISTAGKGPALAVRLRDRIASLIGPAHGRFLDLLGEFRQEVATRIADFARRRALWYRIVDSDALDAVQRGDEAAARARLTELLEQAVVDPEPVLGPAPRAPGAVYLVGAGPGNPGLITVRGRELVQTCDVLVHDRLVADALVHLAPIHAERVFVGKAPGRHTCAQAEINAVLIDRARSGRRVVRLKGGDPFVFGRGGEEVDALRTAGIRYEVIPGVTSAIAAPAAAGIPVTDRRWGSAFAVVTGHECAAGSDLDWPALARIPTLVILMGLGQLARLVERLISSGAAPDTPVAVVSQATLPHQTTVAATLATISDAVRDAALEPPATIIVGEVVRAGFRLEQAGTEDQSQAVPLPQSARSPEAVVSQPGIAL